MSRLAKKPIPVPAGVTVAEDNGVVRVKGPKGSLDVNILSELKLDIGGSEIKVTPASNEKLGRMNAGTMWSLVKNAIEGVTQGYSKILEIEGVGYRAAMEGTTLVLSLGFVNPVKVVPPEGIAISVEKNVITVSGISKELVGRIAAEIRSHKKPEPYKGKGIHYRGEVIRRKVGKKAGATTAAA